MGNTVIVIKSITNDLLARKKNYAYFALCERKLLS